MHSRPGCVWSWICDIVMCVISAFEIISRRNRERERERERERLMLFLFLCVCLVCLCSNVSFSGCQWNVCWPFVTFLDQSHIFNEPSSFYLHYCPVCKYCNSGDDCIQNFHLERFIVRYMDGNLVLFGRTSRAVKRDF